MSLDESVLLAHLSDLHLTRPGGFTPRHWNVKRGFGYLNWRERKKTHLNSVLDRLTADMLAQNPDHVAVTGDLVNIGLPAEYPVALKWLESVGPSDKVTVVPGNHDIYVKMRSDPGHRLWSAYMTPFGDTARDIAFPFVRRIGCVALIGVNSAIPTPPFVAAGKVGRRQREKLATALEETAEDVRVVLIHHPPLPHQAPPRRALEDAVKVTKVLDECGADLVLHGHNHTDTTVWRDTKHGRTLVAGIASGSAGRSHHGAPLARYNLFRLSRVPNGAKIEFHARGLLSPDGPVMDLERKTYVSGNADILMKN